MILVPVDDNGCSFGNHCRRWAGDVIIKIEVDRIKLITSLIYGLPLQFFICLGQRLGWVIRAFDHMDPSHPCRWRGKQPGHHGHGVCASFV